MIVINQRVSETSPSTLLKKKENHINNLGSSIQNHIQQKVTEQSTDPISSKSTKQQRLRIPQMQKLPLSDVGVKACLQSLQRRTKRSLGPVTRTDRATPTEPRWRESRDGKESSDDKRADDGERPSE
ncbi:hypothetical protein RIF29_00633 [Crotalaria pallida]|uniref:Uncharacterized protein n=1 Tax=Crotalaria pallida TaxID=3830 RepID=A0AAN9P7B0_CROPI